MFESKILFWVVVALFGLLTGALSYLVKRLISQLDKNYFSLTASIEGLKGDLKHYAKHETLDDLSDEIDEVRKRLSECATHKDIDRLREKEINVLDQDIKKLGREFSEVVREEVGQLRKDQKHYADKQDDRFEKLFFMIASGQQIKKSE